MSSDTLKIFFMNYGPYLGCSGVHVHFLANALVELGHECHVFLPRTEGAFEYFGTTHYSIDGFRNITAMPLDIFENGIIHAWTTRETVRVPTAIIRKRLKLPYLVHLEDDEILITGKSIGLYTLEEQKAYAKKNPQEFANTWTTHPLHFEPFMRASSGVTCIMNTLEKFVPQGVPRMTFWPSCEETFFQLPRQRDFIMRNACGFDDNTHILVYPGTIHFFNGHYFAQLLLAVDQLHQEGFSLKIIRCGIEDYTYDEEIAKLYNKYVNYYDGIRACDLPKLISLADILVQPGAPRAFDDHRFPSKAPYFLASGRPVLLPDTNVAEKLRHGRDCFLMKKGDSEEIVKYLRMLITHPELAESVGAQGRIAARSLFCWKKAAQSLIPFYKDALSRAQKKRV